HRRLAEFGDRSIGGVPAEVLQRGRPVAGDLDVLDQQVQLGIAVAGLGTYERHPFVQFGRSDERGRGTVAIEPHAGEADAVRLPGRDPQHAVALSTEDDRRQPALTVVLPQHGEAPFQMVETGAGSGERKLRRVELLPGVAGAEAEFQPAVEEQIGGADVAGEQRGVVERRVDDERPQPHPFGGLGCRDQRGKRRAHTDVVGYGEDVEPEILSSTAHVLPVSPYPRGENDQAESELHARTLPKNGLRASAAKVGDPENHWKTTRPTRARLPTVRTVPDDLFPDPRLAALYDTFDDPRDDIPLYVGIADELRARRVLDVGCGTGEPAVALA